MKLSVLTSSYNKVGRHINNKLIENIVNKNTILFGYLGLKTEGNGSINEYLGGDG